MVVLARSAEVAFPPATLTVEGFSDTDMPDEGETVVDRATVPVNPLSPLVVTVELPDVPAKSDRLLGFAETEKVSVDSFQPVSG